MGGGRQGRGAQDAAAGQSGVDEGQPAGPQEGEGEATARAQRRAEPSEIF